jgi:hypothetical protein
MYTYPRAHLQLKANVADFIRSAAAPPPRPN